MPTPALELQDVQKRFGMTEIIRGVDLRIEAGERHAIIGPNGAGKSTLFHLIGGKLHPDRGEIRLHGTEIAGLAPFEISRLGLGRSFQITNLFQRLSALENVRCALLWPMGYRYSFWHLVDRQTALDERARALLARTGLTSRAHVPAGALSYAEQRALEIAVTIAGDAGVIMLDEPTAGMSRSETERMVALIREVTEGRTLVMIEHDMGVVFDLADRISVLAQGRVLATGARAAIRLDPAVREAYLGVGPD